MLILLPPSETKREGGSGAFRLDALSYPELTAARRTAVAATAELAQDAERAARVLKLGPRGAGDIERNRRLPHAEILPAIDRYTGVLFDALDAASLDAGQRAFAHEHVAVQSALLGLVHALDPVPAYRLSATTRLPGLRLAEHWRPARELLAHAEGLIIDARSKAYAALAPLPDRADAYALEVVTPSGAALNHFNKAGKGRLVRRIVEAGRAHESGDALLEWAAEAGIPLDRPAERTLRLTVER